MKVRTEDRGLRHALAGQAGTDRYWRRTVLPVAAAIVLICMPLPVAAERYESVHSEFPADRFIVGIGETEQSSSSLKDERLSVINSRLEVARWMHVRLGTDSFAGVCRGRISGFYQGQGECVAELARSVDALVDGLAQAATIDRQGVQGRNAYAVAVLPRVRASGMLRETVEGAVRAVRDNLFLSRNKGRQYVWKARDEYVRARAADLLKYVIDGSPVHDKAFYDDMELELQVARK